jgi:hypothetical protein
MIVIISTPGYNVRILTEWVSAYLEVDAFGNQIKWDNETELSRRLCLVYYLTLGDLRLALTRSCLGQTSKNFMLK